MNPQYSEAMLGKRFGRWTVLRRYKGDYYICRCDCGKEKAVRGHNLRAGMTRSCGCLRRETNSERLTACWERLRELEAAR